MNEQWKISGDMILNCSCTVFCPCVVSLGEHPPTEGNCQAWMGINIEDGFYGDTSLGGLKVGLLLDIPGQMSRGNWTVALYIDETADDAATEALTTIMSGQARGTTGVLRMLVGNVLGVKKVPIEFSVNGHTRSFSIPRLVEGAIEPIPGSSPDTPVTVNNTRYWMGSEVIISTALKGRVRDWGRVWDFDGRSAEYMRINWSGPGRR